MDRAGSIQASYHVVNEATVDEKLLRKRFAAVRAVGIVLSRQPFMDASTAKHLRTVWTEVGITQFAKANHTHEHIVEIQRVHLDRLGREKRKKQAKG